MKNNKSLGQHWLKNRSILDEIADFAAAGMDQQTVCLEIGPGLGTLTASLLKRFPKVIAVEYDQRLAENLPKSFPGKNLQVVQGDILQSDILGLVDTDDYIVAGNIPYYITSPIVRLLIELRPAPRRIVLLIQKEVAWRIAAAPGNHSFLSLTVQNRMTVKLGPVIPAAEFTPPPKVDSQILILEPLAEPRLPETAFSLIQRGFSAPRKKLIHNLANEKISKADWRTKLTTYGIDPNVRAEDLDFDDWTKLTQPQSEHTS